MQQRPELERRMRGSNPEKMLGSLGHAVEHSTDLATTKGGTPVLVQVNPVPDMFAGTCRPNI
jgi:hypothetical protein